MRGEIVPDSAGPEAGGFINYPLDEGFLMFLLTGSAWTFRVHAGRCTAIVLITKGRGSGEGWVPDWTGSEGWRMTGSALTRWTLNFSCDSLSKGGWFGRGKGLAILHNRRLADF